MTYLIYPYAAGVFCTWLVSFFYCAEERFNKDAARLILAAPVWPIALTYVLFKKAFGVEYAKPRVRTIP